MRFRTKLFLAAAGVAALSLAVSVLLVSWSLRWHMVTGIERNLVSEVNLAAELLSNRPVTPGAVSFDETADTLGRLVGLRVTLIAPDGMVLGDSAVDRAALATVENHATRPEVAEALRSGIGVTSRHSATVDADMLYAAARVRGGPIAIVRLALPLTDVQRQLRAVRVGTLVAFAVGLGGALLLAWTMSTLLTRRVQAIAKTARRYATGDLAQPAHDYGRDEIGDVARVLNDAVHQLGRRLDELSRDRARMEAILSGMVEGVLVVNERGHLQLANDAVRRMLNLQDPIAGRHYLEIVRHPEVAAQIATALAGDTPEGAELTLGLEQHRVFVARAAPVAGPAVTGAVLVLHDITDLRRADQIRRDFVANVSHELRTPLTAVRGYVEALLDDPGDRDQQAQFLPVIARHTLRMERLVKDLLRLARLDAGQERLEIGEYDVCTVFADVITDLSPAIEARGQEVAVRVADTATRVSGDLAKLHDVLRNLVENAVNYAPSGTAIELSSSAVDGAIVLQVADRGPGIPEADLVRVFERFYRVDKARARDPGGTGLGLAIVKHLVGLHHGTVTAANRHGGGTIFAVTLPPARRYGAHSVTPASSPPGLDGTHHLLCPQPPQ